MSSRAIADAQTFGPMVKEVIDTLPAPSQRASAVFSTACFRHCVTDTAAFWNVAVAPSTLERARRRSGAEPPVSLRDAGALVSPTRARARPLR